METLNELNEAIESATNVETVYYSKPNKKWIVVYKEETGLPEDVLETDDLIHFLINA